jgi:sugar diacid utilization regulator
LYPPEPKQSPEVVKKNKELIAKQKEFMDQAEREVVGESIISAPLKHMENQEAIINRAAALSLAFAEGKDPGLFVSTDRDRIRANLKSKWYVYEQGGGKIRMYSPEEKVYVDLPLKDIPLVEKWFKLPVEKWKKWNK